MQRKLCNILGTPKQVPAGKSADGSKYDSYYRYTVIPIDGNVNDITTVKSRVELEDDTVIVEFYPPGSTLWDGTTNDSDNTIRVLKDSINSADAITSIKNSTKLLDVIHERATSEGLGKL
tara:strand:+ start:240 stop:599 length:360 start_codon:yes stop_codon:yes gene_type:complete